jgi:membrane glycosyltransferase
VKLFPSQHERTRFAPTFVKLPLGGCASSAEGQPVKPSFRFLITSGKIKSSPGSSHESRGDPIAPHSDSKAREFAVFIKVLAFLSAAAGLAWGLSHFHWMPILWERSLIGLLFFFAFFNLALYLTGFVIFWSGSSSPSLVSGQNDSSGAAAKQSGLPKVAICMAIYHEDVQQVTANIRKTWMSVRQAGLTSCCDFFLLSDSNDSEIRQSEDQMYARLRSELGSTSRRLPGDLDAAPAPGQIFLIRRTDRKHYKAGNIGNFLEKFGWNYDYMLVLDADSLMLGSAIKRLLCRMEANPKLAIVQSTILPIGARTLFARAMQFSVSRCFPLYALGMSRLLGRQSVYWGHNALLRVRSFLDHAKLLIMPGQPPLGGPIMSHDIVEAALLGRAGFAIEWDLEAAGSYDEIPEDVLRYGKRDRRWCQGNFQHFWLICGDGIQPWHRFYFATGIFSYLAGPLILLLALSGFARAAANPMAEAPWRFDLKFAAFLLLIIGTPKVLGLIRLARMRLRLAPSPHGDGFKRAARETVSTLLELLLSISMAPMLFYLHLRFVLEILSGNVVAWTAQTRRVCEPISWREAAAVFWPPTLLGVLWGLAAIQFTPHLFPGLALILGGWIFSIPLAVATSNPKGGALFARFGLFERYLSWQEALECNGVSQEKLSPAPNLGRPYSRSPSQGAQRDMALPAEPREGA